MKFALALLALTFAAAVGAVNIPPDGIPFSHAVTCKVQQGSCLWTVQEIPGTDLEASIVGNSESSSVTFSFPAALFQWPAETTDEQEFLVHVSASRRGSAFVSAELFEDGFYVGVLLLCEAPGSGCELLKEISIGGEDVFLLPWKFSDLSDTTGADLEVNIQIYGECINPTCPPNTTTAGLLQAIGWENPYVVE